jgi:hypothetical protein
VWNSRGEVRVIVQFGFWLATWGIAFSQVTSERPVGPVPTGSELQFEVASVKIVQPGARDRMRIAGGPGTNDPERITFEFCTLKYLLLYAYAPTFDIASYTDDPIVTGPSWLVNGGTYGIAAKFLPGQRRSTSG